MRRCDCRLGSVRDARASHVPAHVASRPRRRPSSPRMPAHAASPERARQLRVRIERGTPLAAVGAAYEGTNHPRNDRRQPRWGHGGNAQYRRPWPPPAIQFVGYSPHCAKQPNSTPKRPTRRRLITSCGMTIAARRWRRASTGPRTSVHRHADSRRGRDEQHLLRELTQRSRAHVRRMHALIDALTNVIDLYLVHDEIRSGTPTPELQDGKIPVSYVPAKCHVLVSWLSKTMRRSRICTAPRSR